MKNNKSKEKTTVYEYENADNGAIFVCPEMRIVEICGENVDEKASLIGLNIYEDINHYLEDYAATAVRVTVKIEEIEPKY